MIIMTSTPRFAANLSAASVVSSRIRYGVVMCIIKEKGHNLSKQMFYANNRLVKAVRPFKFYLTWVQAFVLKHFVRVKITKNNRLLVRVCAIPVCNFKLGKSFDD